VTCGTTDDSTLTTDQCQSKDEFNSTSSSTYVSDGTDFKITYGSGYAKGFQGMDTVRFGSAGGPQLVIPNTTFAQVTDFDSSMVDSPLDGILGLAFQNISINNVVPPFMNAVAQNLVTNPLFTVYMETASNSEADAPVGGVYTFGDVDTINCGAVIDWVPLFNETWWEFTIDNCTVGTTNVSTDPSQVVSDTGTSLLVGDKALVKVVAKAAGAKYYSKYGLYLIKCDATYDPISFSINGRIYNITSDFLNMDVGIKQDNWCLFGAAPMDGLKDDLGLDWVLGDPFIRAFCQIYDVGNYRLGLAPPLVPPPKAGAASSSSSSSGN